MTKRLISFLIALCLLIAIPLSARYKYNPFTRKLDYYEPVSGSDLGDLGDVTLTGLATGNILYYNGTAWVNLATGVNTNVLTLAGGVPTWAAPGAPAAHAASHEVGGADLVDHDQLTNYLAAQHLTLPNTIVAVLTDHNQAAHNALNIDADTVDGEHAAAIVTNARVKAHFPDTIANILSDHNLAAHTALGLFDASADVDHDATTNWVANKHINWTAAADNFSTSEDFFLAWTEAADHAVITQTAVAGPGGSPLINIDDDRTGVTADAVGEATIYMDVDGLYALYIANGEFGVADVFGYDYTTEHTLSIGYLAGEDLVAGGEFNTLIGEEAGANITTGDNNAAVGYQALYFNMTGSNNTIFGYRAGYGVITNSYSSNSFVGYEAGYSATTGANSTFIGYQAGYFIASSWNNVAIGHSALYANKGPDVNTKENVAIGMEALGDIGAGSQGNVAVGHQALWGVDDDSDYNTGVGYKAAYTIDTGSSDNVFIGRQAGYDATTLNQNVIIGSLAALNITSGSGNVVIGYMAGEGWLIAQDDLLIIDNSDTATPLIYGDFAADNITINGDFNVTMDAALDQLGIVQTAVAGTENQPLINIDDDRTGATVDEAIEATIYMNADGLYALYLADGFFGVADWIKYDEINYSVVYGYQAGNSLTANSSYNVLLGYKAGFDLTQGDSNVYIGYHAGYENVTGDWNIAIGQEAMQGQAGQSAYANVAIGYTSMLLVTTGSFNVAVGQQTAVAMTDGQYNTIIGYSAGASLSTGDRNVVIGNAAGGAWLDAEDDLLVIDSSNTATPLIYGDFSADEITINGKLSATDTIYADGGIVHVMSKEVNFDDGSPVAIATVADGYMVTCVIVEVTTTWDGNGTIVIGDGNDPDGYLEDANITQGAAAYYGWHHDERGTYLWDSAGGGTGHDDCVIYTGADTVDATLVAGTSSQGVATVYIHIIRLK